MSAATATAAPTITPPPPREARRRRVRPVTVLKHAALLAGGLAWLYPLFWVFGGSLKTTEDFFDAGLNPWPSDLQWGNYADAWRGASFGQYFLNTVILTAVAVTVVLAASSMAGYVLARTKFPGRGLALGLIAVTLFLPHGYTIIPVFDLVQRLHLLNTLWSVIVVQASGGLVFATFLFMGYFQSMDKEIEEAAKIDGASFPQTFYKIMLPLSGSMAATVGLFTTITAWNSFFVPLVFTLARPDLRTLAVGMYAFIGENSTNWTLLCAGSVITLAPIIVLFLLLQRYFVNGLAGAVKQ